MQLERSQDDHQPSQRGVNATVLEVGELRQGKRFALGYHMVKFALDTGEFALSYIGPDFRNWTKWGPVSVGNTYAGVRLLPRQAGPLLIHADSVVTLLGKDAPACRIISQRKPKPKPVDPQMDLL